ncbi:class I SAM-dependent methyltransferase [soil metagenome]|jgi:precorrin-6B methylase 2
MKLKLALLFIYFSCCFSKCHPQQKDTVPAPAEKTAKYVTGKASADGIGKFYLGREIAHVMGASGSDWLERDDRDKEENTSLAIEKIQLPANGVAADIGAGTGYYSFRLAAKVPQGKVYAVEIQDEMIALLKNKKQQIKDSVVDIVKSTALSPNLPPNSTDLAIMTDVYHELEYPAEMLQAIYTALKPDGKLLLIEYRGEDASIPIKALHKTTVAQLNKELAANGFKLGFKGDFLPIQHFLLYEKIK